MRMLSLLLLTLLCTSGRAQKSQAEAPKNLIENGGFENYRHKNVKVAGQLTPDDFSYALPGWSMTLGAPIVCTSAYTGEAVDTTGWKCLDGEIDIFAGDVIMEIEYMANCWAPWMDEPGCADNISYTLNEPLDIGKVYEFSFWIDTRAVASNDDEAGRSQNRRVDIQQAPGDPPALIYRKLIDAIEAGDRKAAIKRLLIWSNIAREDKLLLARNDPRLTTLMADPGVLRLFNERMNKVYPRLAKPNGARELDSLWAEDQAPRTLHKWIENLRYYHHDLDGQDSTSWYIGPLVSDEAWVAHDGANLPAIEAWIKHHGWPKRTVVGLRAAEAAPLILIHSEDTMVMQRYLPIAEAACREGEGEWGYYALLYDRLQVTKGLPQRYGTQYRRNAAGERELFPEEDPEMTAVWRREIGL